ncbi:MAG: hypothetical protein Q8N18_23000 [Opitutaceae bacterium]|nr:hypothetical protein [Opitutaceae bacterium]
MLLAATVAAWAAWAATATLLPLSTTAATVTAAFAFAVLPEPALLATAATLLAVPLTAPTAPATLLGMGRVLRAILGLSRRERATLVPAFGGVRSRAIVAAIIRPRCGSFG